MLDVAASMTAEELKTAPLMSDLRRSVIHKTVVSLREENREQYVENYMRKHQHTDITHSPELLSTASPVEEKAHKAVSQFAEARRRRWMKNAIEHIDSITHFSELKTQMEEARATVTTLDTQARRWLKPFGLEATKRPTKTQSRVRTQEKGRSNASRPIPTGCQRSLERSLNRSVGDKKKG